MELSDHDDCRSEVLAYRMYRESQAHPNALDYLERILISGDPLDPREIPAGEILDGAADAGPAAFPAGPDRGGAGTVVETLPAETEVISTEALSVRDAKGGGLFGRLRKH